MDQLSTTLVFKIEKQTSTKARFPNSECAQQIFNSSGENKKNVPRRFRNYTEADCKPRKIVFAEHRC